MGANAQTTVPTFTSGQVLTADQQNQSARTGVPVFATTVERDAAFGGSGEKTLAEGQLAYLEDSNIVQYYDGSVWATLAPTPAPTMAIFNETQATNTEGGTFTSGSYVKRTLNTTVVNNIASCTLSSSVISLPAGTYHVTANAPGFQVAGHKIRLQDTTASATIAIGSGENSAAAANYAQTRSMLDTHFTLATTSNIELQHRCASTRNLNGLGVESSFGDDNVFSQITITKVA